MKSLGDLLYSREAEEESTLKEKHTPTIEAPTRARADEAFDLTIVVGKEVPHPNLLEHHIKWIRVFVEEKGRSHNPIHVGTYDMGPTYMEPRVSFPLKLKKSSTVYALGYCNLHGIWENSVDITVE
ncbi:MAG: class II SORL domain-containing protein [Thermoplasmata archaeon]